MIFHNFVGSKTPAVATSGVTAGANMNVMRKLRDNIRRTSRIFVFLMIESDDIVYFTTEPRYNGDRNLV